MEQNKSLISLSEYLDSNIEYLNSNIRTLEYKIDKLKGEINLLYIMIFAMILGFALALIIGKHLK